MASVDFSSITTEDNYRKRHDDYEQQEEVGLLQEVTEEPAAVEGGAAAGSAASRAPPRIYGRRDEHVALLEAYQRLLVAERAQTVIVHGESGSGKTALVDTLREPVCEADSYFVSGKFFQLDGTAPAEPYSAIMAAFSDLCDLVLQSDDYGEDEQREMKEALGSEAQILVKSISNLSPLIGAVNGIEAMEAASFAQFEVACRTFLRAVASERHPVVVFVDDIQWADEGSTKLIQMFLRDDSVAALENVMFILAYRDEEAASVIESGMLDGIQDQTDIALSNLDADGVHEMVTSILRSPRTDEIKKLSDLVARRTLGNPLFVMLFMETVQQEGLLAYDTTTRSWIFDVVEMQSEIMVSETLVELLTRKIDRLSFDLTSVLKITSLLGYHFSESILLHVATTSARIMEASSVVASLNEAVKEGFIEMAGDGQYHFSHDKVQSAFKSLIGESDGARLHLLVGEAYLFASDNGGASSTIYRAAVHLSCAPGFLTDYRQRVKFARINLQAAKYCKEISAFEQAILVLQSGMDALGPIGKWSDDHFDLTFEMMETQARMQLVVGDFEGCKATTLEASRHVKTAEMSIKLLAIDIDFRSMAGNEAGDVFATANRGLRALGFNLPRKATVGHLLTKLWKLKFMLRHKTDEDILNLPVAQDVVVANVVTLLIHLGTFCFVKLETAMAVSASLLAVELTLKNGFCQHSPCAFVIYGVLEAGTGNIDRGCRFGKLALEMLQRRNSREGEGPTVGYAQALLLFWKKPLNQLQPPLRKAASSAFQHGDIIYGTYCMSITHNMQVQSGEHLADVEVAIRATYDRVRDLGQGGILRWLQPLLQYVINLQTDVDSWEHMAFLTGEIMNEEDYMNEVCEKQHHQIRYMICAMWKAFAAVYFGQFSFANSIWKGCRAYRLKDLHFAWSGSDVIFNQALVRYGLYELTGQDRQLRKGRKHRRALQRYHAAGNPNATPLLAYLVAHEASVQKKYYSDGSALRAIFRTGFDGLVASNRVHLEGLLSERAGFCFIRLGMRAEAESHFERALHVYQNEWGAIAKYNQLKETSAIALNALTPYATDNRLLPLTGRSISVPAASSTRVRRSLASIDDDPNERTQHSQQPPGGLKVL